MPWKSLNSAGGQHKGPRSRQRPVFFSFSFCTCVVFVRPCPFSSDKHTPSYCGQFQVWKQKHDVYIYIVFPSTHEKFQGFIHNQVLLERLRDLGFGALALKLWDVFLFGCFLLKIRCPNCKKKGKVTEKPRNNVWRTPWDWEP